MDHALGATLRELFFIENSCNFWDLCYNKQKPVVIYTRQMNLEVFLMAENKQYITQMQENGRVMISEDVVATIALHSLSDIEGFAGLSVRPGADIADMLGMKNGFKGIKVTITDQNELVIDCNVMIHYGQCVVAVAKSIQEAVRSALESTTGAKVLNVNVNVCGIVRK